MYLDVFFLVNVIMDGMLLLLVKRFLKAPGSWRSMGAAAVLGGVWACGAVVAENALGCGAVTAGSVWERGTAIVGSAGAFKEWLWWIFRFLVWLSGAATMVYLAFRPGTRRDLIRYLLVFWIASAAAGGVYGAVLRNGSRSLAGVLCIGIGICFGGSAAAEYLREQKRLQERLYEVTIHYQGRQETVKALWDTGNQLYEPYGHQPVHVISQEAVRRLGDQVTGVIYIPFSAVGTEHGMLPGIRADWMEVAKDGAMVRRLERPWLGISREPLSAARRYEMLLHGEES